MKGNDRSVQETEHYLQHQAMGKSSYFLQTGSFGQFVSITFQLLVQPTDSPVRLHNHAMA